MGKARPSGKGRRISGAGKAKPQAAKRVAPGKPKAEAAKARRPVVAKPQVSRAGVSKAPEPILIRADDGGKIRRPAQVALPIAVIPETPPPLPAPIASFTF